MVSAIKLSKLFRNCSIEITNIPACYSASIWARALWLSTSHSTSSVVSIIHTGHAMKYHCSDAI